MTYKEMYDHLAADLGKVEYRKAYYLPKAVREFRKAIKFPVWKWYEYKVPSTNNKYVIFYYAENADFVEKPTTGYFVDVFFDKQRYVGDTSNTRLYQPFFTSIQREIYKGRLTINK